MKKYLQLDWKKSNLFEYSKEEKEGFEPHTNTKGTVSYRKWYNEGITGTLNNIGIKESQIGDQLILTVNSGDIEYRLQFGLYDQSGFVEDKYVESIIRVLGNLKKGEEYKIFPYNLTAEAKEKMDQENGKEIQPKYYDTRGVSIKTSDGNKIEKALNYVGEGELIPQVKWVENKAKPGKKKQSAASSEIKSDFLVEKLMSYVNGHLKWENSQSTSTQPAQSKFEPAPIGVEEDNLDLPF